MNKNSKFIISIISIIIAYAIGYLLSPFNDMSIPILSELSMPIIYILTPIIGLLYYKKNGFLNKSFRFHIIAKIVCSILYLFIFFIILFILWLVYGIFT